MLIAGMRNLKDFLAKLESRFSPVASSLKDIAR